MTFTLLGLIKCSNSPLDRPIFFTSGSRFNNNAGSPPKCNFSILDSRPFKKRFNGRVCGEMGRFDYRHLNTGIFRFGVQSAMMIVISFPLSLCFPFPFPSIGFQACHLQMNSKVAEVKAYELKRILGSTKASRILLRTIQHF
jgi:hypothetical protein